jgi:cytochrome c-type biogenesis protein CcmH
MVHRRHLLGAVAASFVAGRLAAQDMSGMQGSGGNGTRMMMAGGKPMRMKEDVYLPVQLPPKPAPHAVMTKDQTDDLEHHIHCQCGCGLDVYTCRTTDFSCTVSPAMHLDVLGLANGGYTAGEIIAAFRRVYGDGVLMAPAKEGFNWLAYLLPFGMLLTGAVVVVTLLRRWSHVSRPALPLRSSSDATPDELERLRRLLRSDE